MKKFHSLIAAAGLALAASSASAVVVCDTCDYLTGFAATNLGVFNPNTFDSATFGNSTAGQNGNFDNTWVFTVNPGGKVDVDAIFLPLNDISNFAVKLFNVTSDVCGPSLVVTGGACLSRTLGSLIATGTTNPAFATELETGILSAGIYAFDISGTISGLLPGQPASYTGNVQVSAVPEPDSLALIGLGLVALGWLNKRKQKQQ